MTTESVKLWPPRLNSRFRMRRLRIKPIVCWPSVTKKGMVPILGCRILWHVASLMTLNTGTAIDSAARNCMTVDDELDDGWVL